MLPTLDTTLNPRAVGALSAQGHAYHYAVLPAPAGTQLATASSTAEHAGSVATPAMELQKRVSGAPKPARDATMRRGRTALLSLSPPPETPFRVRPQIVIHIQKIKIFYIPAPTSTHLSGIALRSPLSLTTHQIQTHHTQLCARPTPAEAGVGGGRGRNAFPIAQRPPHGGRRFDA